MLAYRICLRQFAHNPHQAFSGNGGLAGLGRWHNVGRQIIYSAQSLSLAALESLVHIQRSDKIQPYVYWAIAIPERHIVAARGLPSDWMRDQIGTRAYGDAWLAARRSVALAVPSAIVPREFNYLINPMHPAFSVAWVSEGPVAFEFDQRLTRPGR